MSEPIKKAWGLLKAFGPLRFGNAKKNRRNFHNAGKTDHEQKPHTRPTNTCKIPGFLGDGTIY